MQDQSKDLLLAEYAMGHKADEFLQSDLGRFIVGRCEQEAQDAQERLSTVLPWRRNRIKELQNQVWRARSLVLWFNELVSAGIQAEAQLLDQGEDE